MNTLTVVFTGLVFYASPLKDPKFTNAVLVNGGSVNEHHVAQLSIPGNANVTVKEGALLSTKRTWILGPSSWVIVSAGKSAPGRTGNFVGHVPSIGDALQSAFPDDPDKRGKLAPCTYAEMSGSECKYQQGRVQLSGGTLDAYVPDPDPVYTFITDYSQGKYESRLSHKTMWANESEVESFVIYDEGKTYTVTLHGSITVLVNNEPSHEGRHIGILRELYGLGNNGVEAEFPRPAKDGADLERFRELARQNHLPSEWLPQIRTLSRPIICPPATQ